MMLPSAYSNSVGTLGALISALNGWPGFPLLTLSHNPHGTD
jgi:hypothetical protein